MNQENNDEMGQPLVVGIAGLGRSGWNIHAATLKQLSRQYRIAAVTDPHADRCQEARQQFDARVYPDFQDMLADDRLELIVVASPNHLHAEHAMAAMRSCKHVVVEKPVACNVDEMDEMIATSEQTQRVLAPFQNRRYDPHFLKVRSIIESGELGRIVQIRMAMHSFGRRWDWQTLRELGGGTLNNAGPHFLDLALELFGPSEPQVFCHLDTVLTLGDAEDHVVLILRAAGAPLIQLEMTSACSLRQEFWLVMGDRGTLRGSMEHLEWQVTDLSALPPRQVQRGAAEQRSYNSEKLVWTRREWTVPEQEKTIGWTRQCFYEDLYKTLRQGQPLVVTPQQVRRQISILEQAHEQGRMADLTHA